MHPIDVWGVQKYRPCYAAPGAETGILGVQKYRPCDAAPDAETGILGVQKYRPCDAPPDAETGMLGVQELAPVSRRLRRLARYVAPCGCNGLDDGLACREAPMTKITGPSALDGFTRQPSIVPDGGP